MIDIERANEIAVERMTSARPILTGVAPARDVIPGMRDNLLVHAGPPITWDRASGPLTATSMVQRPAAGRRVSASR